MRTRLVAGVMSALVLVSGCTSSGTSKAEFTSTTTEKLAPLSLPSLASDNLRLAVSDSSHALVIESEQTGIARAALTDNSGKLKPLPQGLPALFNPRVVSTPDGYLIVGLRCADGKPINTTMSDDQQLCMRDPNSGTVEMAEPVAIRLALDGNVTSTIPGPPVDPSSFGGITPSSTDALIDLNGTFYTISSKSFTPVQPPADDINWFIPCKLPDGQLIAFAIFDATPKDDTDEVTRRAYTYQDNGWAAIGDPVKFDGVGSAAATCAVGGIVSNSSIFDSLDSPVSAHLPNISLETFAGITPDGLVFVNKNPARLVNPTTGEVVTSMPDAHAVAISWDGKTIAQVTKDGIRLESRP